MARRLPFHKKRAFSEGVIERGKEDGELFKPLFLLDRTGDFSTLVRTAARAFVFPRPGTGAVLHEGWAVKESGSALFGKTNWRRRWFRLVQRTSTVTLEYYRCVVGVGGGVMLEGVVTWCKDH